MNNEVQQISCRSCKTTGLNIFLDLGKTPLANALLTREQLEEPEVFYPLKVAFCPNCSLVQITETVPPDILFREYLYFSSVSNAILKNAQDIVEYLIPSRRLGSDNLVVEIASNDGYLLQNYQHYGIPVLGIEPARNIAAHANQNGIRTLPEFFNRKLAQQLKDQGQQADVIHANNVIAHVADLNGVITGIQILLKKNGLAIIEFPYVRDLIEKVEFDTIYHEHLCYFSLTAFDRLARQHGLIVQDVHRLPIHGGSLRLFVTRQGAVKSSEAVQEMLKMEAELGMRKISYYQDFADQVEKLKGDLLELLTNLKHQGNCIAAYGASAKGCTLLNYFGIGSDLIDFVVDLSPHKQGRMTPGMHLPIVAPDNLLKSMPEYTLLLTWNFKEEILEQQVTYRQRGGKFILPIPNIEVI